MALDLEDGGQPVTDIDSAGILAGPLNDLRSLGWQGLQPFLRGFIGTMLRPHGRENSELAQIRRTSKPCQDEVPFLTRQPHRGGVLEGHGRILMRRAHDITHDIRASRLAVSMVAPSALPSSAEMARSGCGIMPITRPFAETMPAMSRAAPFGLAGPTISLST